MSKQQVFTLDIEEEDYGYPDHACLFFHTLAPGYAFVDDLNRLYSIARARRGDMQLRGVSWPLYVCFQPVSKLHWRVVERPRSEDSTAPHWQQGQKLLILQGNDARLVADRIEEDFGTPLAIPDDGDHTARRRQGILQGYQQTLMPVSRMDPGQQADTPLSRKAAKERAELESLVYEILDYLDRHEEKK